MKSFTTIFATLIALTFTISAPATPQSKTAKQKTTQKITKSKSIKSKKSKIKKIPLRHRLNITIKNLKIKDQPAHIILQKLCDAAQINLLINWKQLESLGYEKEQLITIAFKEISIKKLLLYITEEITPKDEEPLVLDHDRKTLSIVTKDQANQKLVLRTYDVRAQTMAIRDFNSPPINLSNALNSGGSGSNNSGGGGSLFDDDNDEKEDKPLTAKQKGQSIAQLIRNTIEPDLWDGDAYVKFYRGKLYVKAPQYVHIQIDH